MTEPSEDFDWNALDGEAEATPADAILAARMMNLIRWAGRNKARQIAIDLVLMQDRRGVREASLSAKVDRCNVYRAMREARSILEKKPQLEPLSIRDSGQLETTKPS